MLRRVQAIWHNMTHQHVTLEKEGVATVDLCAPNRVYFGRIKAHLTFHDETLASITLPDLTPENSKVLFKARTPLEMRQIAVQIIRGEVTGR